MDTIDGGATADRGPVRVTGWVWFAGILLILAGGFNIIHGFTAIEDKSYFSSHIVYNNLTFWGWVFLIWGVLEVFAGLASVTGNTVGNYLGVLIASWAVILWFIMIFVSPGAAVVGVAINTLIIYGLTAGASAPDLPR
jgi:hypothetical protein